MSKSNPWSGLAPAVDAHLKRWQIIRRAFELTQPFFVGPGPKVQPGEVGRLIDQLARQDAAARWLTFARSYGLPGADGVPLSGLSMVPTSEEETAVHAVEGSTISGKEQFQDNKQSTLQGLLLIRREHEMLTNAVTHYVSAEVCEELELAAEQAFPEPLFETDLVTPAGFAVLEKPVSIIDLNIHTGLPDSRVHIQIRAIGWQRHEGILSPLDGTVGEGVTLFCYTTPVDYRDGYLVELAETGEDVKDVWATEFDIDGPFMPVEVIPWRFGVEWTSKAEDVIHHIPGTVPTPVAFQRRWFYTFQRLMWQQIIVRTPPHEPRQMLRKWARLAEKKKFLDYKALRLRRLVDPDYKPSGLGMPLEYQVKVRAHWHYAYCPSMGGPARLPDGKQDPMNHRWVWIEAYWKGPEDGPLGPWHNATSVIR